MNLHFNIYILKIMCLICSSEILCSSLYMMRISLLVSEVWQVGLAEIHVRKMLKNTFSWPSLTKGLFLPSFDDFHLFSFIWSKSKGGGREDPWNILKLALQINVRLLSAHKIFYKSLMAPGGTWVIKSVKATFFLPNISHCLSSGYFLCLFNIC